MTSVIIAETNHTILIDGEGSLVLPQPSVQMVTIGIQGPSGAGSGDQNLFSTIAVSGQNDVIADSTSDTLTLVAGSNITITTNAGTDTITIAASGGGAGTFDYGMDYAMAANLTLYGY